MSIAGEERMVRALHAPFWDDQLQRGTKSAFQQLQVSLSRLAVLPYAQIVDAFVADLNRPASEMAPERKVKGTATIEVDTVLRLCADSKKAQVAFRADPVTSSATRRENPSHALMLTFDPAGEVKKLPDAVAQSIMKSAAIQTL
ncbi:hypothetical protein [Variovorax boronicumulans]